MVTALTPGYIYLIESDSVDNVDWITASGDPDNIDLSLFTGEGTDYCKIQIPKQWTSNAHTGIIVTDASGGSSFDFRSARRGYSVVLRGLQTSLANAALIDKFIMSDRHTVGASATFHRYHLIVYYGVNTHVKFTDSSSTQQSYCTGDVITFFLSWIQSESLIVGVNITFRSVW